LKGANIEERERSAVEIIGVEKANEIDLGHWREVKCRWKCFSSDMENHFVPPFNGNIESTLAISLANAIYIHASDLTENY